jgi:hypothetical protein
VRTSTAKANGYRCPVCHDETTRDESGMGFVRHKRRQDCKHEEGQRDEVWFLAPANKDTGSLRTGNIHLEVGDIIEIKDEGKHRTVTHTMGAAGNLHSTFKGQGAVPVRDIEWRIVSRAESKPLAPPPPPTPVAHPPPDQHKPKSRLEVLYLVLQIIGGIVAIVGGILAIIWKSK